MLKIRLKGAESEYLSIKTKPVRVGADADVWVKIQLKVAESENLPIKTKPVRVGAYAECRCLVKDTAKGG